MPVAGQRRHRHQGRNYRALAAKIKSAGADCFFFGGITANNGVQL